MPDVTRGGFERQDPAVYAAAITPHDTNDLAYDIRAIYVGGAGDIALITTGGSAVTLSAVPAGSILPIRASRIKATGTTATLIVGLW